MLKLSLITLLAAVASVASAQEQTPEQQAAKQLEVNYKVVCSSDLELENDSELLAIIGNDAGAADVRSRFQAFVTNPKSTVQAALDQYTAIQKDIETQILQVPELVAQVEKDAVAYEKEKGVSAEEAKAAVLANLVEFYMAKQQITQSAVVYESVGSACGFFNMIQTQITASGCKTPAGEAIDVATATQFCGSIAAPMGQVQQISGQLGAIEQQAQALIAAVTASIQKGALAEMTPLLESLDQPIEDVAKAALDLLAVPETVEAPVAVAPVTATPTQETAPVAVPAQN